ncbi:MAG: hypothetical protein VKP62_06655 [Candidatus Sericytochromatia bacterium]|nr:hypothetical protein [Candidatus Sericytochromatia bacterium]
MTEDAAPNLAGIAPDALQAFLERLDEAGEILQATIDGESNDASPVFRVYMDGAAFLEAGYLMVEQLAPAFPAVYRALLEGHYEAALTDATRGRIGWGEALQRLPEFLREYAVDRAAAVLESDD